MGDFESLRSLLHTKTPSLLLPISCFAPAHKPRPSSTRKRTNMDTHNGMSSALEQADPITIDTKDLPSNSSSPVHAAPKVISIAHGVEGESAGEDADEDRASKGGWFAYLKTRNFYLVLLLGYGNPMRPSDANGMSTRSADRCNKDKSSLYASQLRIHSLHYSLHNHFRSLPFKHCGITSFSRWSMAHIQSTDTALRDGSSSRLRTVGNILFWPFLMSRGITSLCLLIDIRMSL